jgi:hypothetical protein
LLIAVITLFLSGLGWSGFKRREYGYCVVQEERDNVTRLRVTHYLVHQLSDPAIIQESTLHRLVAELVKLAQEDRLWTRKLTLSELNGSELLEVVEV